MPDLGVHWPSHTGDVGLKACDFMEQTLQGSCKRGFVAIFGILDLQKLLKILFDKV
jgi:hypothetical protein